MKKSLSVVLALCMLLALVPMSAMAAHVVNGNVINVANAAEAQDVLDGKHGSIDGKTINFTGNIDTVLDLARPAAHQGSNTVYYNYSPSTGLDTTPTEWSENIGSIMGNTSRYYRSVENVTFTANSGVTVAGFTFSSDHEHTSGHDYVRNVPIGNGVTYYRYSSLKNITFNGLTITGNIDFRNSLDSEVSNITIESCTFTRENAAIDSDQAIRMWSATSYYKNITVKNCTISNYFQGVYLHCIDGATVSNNTISNTRHNAIAFQSDATNPAKGNLIVEENYMENVGDRAVRFNYVADANFTMNNNIMVNCGNSSGQLIRDEGSSSTKFNLENNYWDGDDPADVLAGSFSNNLPTAVGINGGTFTKPILAAYTYTGYAPIRNADGTYTVVIPAVESSSSSSLPQTGDNSQLAMWFFLLVMSGAAFALLKRRMANG